MFLGDSMKPFKKHQMPEAGADIELHPTLHDSHSVKNPSLVSNDTAQQGGKKMAEVLKIVQGLWDKAQKAEENYDLYLRAVAELENYRKRVAKERAHEIEAMRVQLLRLLLPIVDNLERALTQICSQPEAQSIRDGLELIGRQVQGFLESVGLKPFASTGEKFDPHKHEAVLHVQRKDHPDHTVLEEVQKGYTLDGRVIRHALVKVVDNPTPENQEPQK